MTPARPAAALAAFRGALDTGRVLIVDGHTSDIQVSGDADPCRLLHLLATESAAAGYAPVQWSPLGHARRLTPPGDSGADVPLPGRGATPTESLSRVLAALPPITTPTILFADYSELVLPAPGGAAMPPESQALVEAIAELPGSHLTHRVVLLLRTGSATLFDRLPGFVRHTVGLPDDEERELAVGRLFPGGKGLDGMDIPAFTRLTGGLTIDDLMRLHPGHESDRTISVSDVRAAKDTALSGRAEALTVYPPSPGFTSVAGLPQVRLLAQHANRTGRPRRRILLAGPPGVGKTRVVNALAGEMGLLCVAFAALRSPWVGESERRLRDALDAIKAQKPLMLHIDEIDQAVGQRGGGPSSDGGTSERILAELWQFLGNNDAGARVVVAATSNRPDLLGEEMRDRFLVMPVLHPSPAECADILTIAAGEEHVHLDPSDAAEATRDLGVVTGRMLIDVLDSAILLADVDDDRTPVITLDVLQAAFEDCSQGVDPIAHEKLALTALAMTRLESFLPWNAAARLGTEPWIPPYARPLLTPDGRMNRDRLRGRLAELGASV